jgi:hypothetical protein
MDAKMLIFVEGDIRAIYTTGGMSGGVQIRSVGRDGEEHAGITPVGVSPHLFSMLRLVPPTLNGRMIAHFGEELARDLGLFDCRGEIKDEAIMRSLIGRLTDAQQDGIAEAQSKATAQSVAQAQAESEARHLANAEAEPSEPAPPPVEPATGETQAA